MALTIESQDRLVFLNQTWLSVALAANASTAGIGMNFSEALRSKAQIVRDLKLSVGQLAEHSVVNRLSAVHACMRNPFQPSVVWEPIFGTMMQLDLREEVSQELFVYGCFEVELVDFFSWAIDPGMTFYDVGAHIGFFSVLCGKLIGPLGTLVCFEPMPATRLHLETNLRNAGLTNVSVRPVAVWDENCKLLLNDFGPHHSAFNSVAEIRLPPSRSVLPVSQIEVEAVTLDSAVDEGTAPPDFVKLDVESAEMEVLNGMKAILTNHRPIVTIEVGDFEHLLREGSPTSKEVLEFVAAFSYQLFEPIVGGIVPHRLKVSDLYDYQNIICVPEEEVEALMMKLQVHEGKLDT